METITRILLAFRRLRGIQLSIPGIYTVLFVFFISVNQLRLICYLNIANFLTFCRSNYETTFFFILHQSDMLPKHSEHFTVYWYDSLAFYTVYTYYRFVAYSYNEELYSSFT